MDTRGILLVIFGLGWLTVLIITAIRGPVPDALWATLALGLGGILGAFRTDEYVRSRQRERDKTSPPPAGPEVTEDAEA